MIGSHGATRAIMRLFALAVPLFAALIAIQWTNPLLMRNLLGAGPMTRTALRLIGCAVMLSLYRTGVRILERRPAAEVSPVGAAAGVLGGALLGLLLFSLVMAILFLAGHASRPELARGWAGLPVFAAALLAAIGEEVVFRGAVFRIVEERWGTSVALAVSAVLFGALHACNEGATIAGIVGVALEAGVLLGIAYSLTRRLWLPIGIHLGWNFAEGGIFGAAVSGGASAGLLHFTLTGSPLWTGAAFGPEASVPAVAVCLLASCIMAARVVGLERWRPFGRPESAESVPER